MSDSATPWTATGQASLSITNSQSLLKLTSIESVMPSNHLILFCPLSSCLQSFPSSRSFQMSQFFTSKYWSSALPSILPMNIQDCFPLGWTEWISLQSKELPSLLQHHSSNVLIIWCFTALFSFLYSPTLTSILDYWKNQCFD